MINEVSGLCLDDDRWTDRLYILTVWTFLWYEEQQLPSGLALSAILTSNQSASCSYSA
jgi:hypothetical protein